MFLSFFSKVGLRAIWNQFRWEWNSTSALWPWAGFSPPVMRMWQFQIFFFFFLLSMFCFPHFLWSLNSSFMGTSFMWFGWIWLHPLSTQTGMWSRPGQVALLKSLVQVEWHEPSQKTRVFLGTFFPELSGKRHSFSLLGLWAIRMMSA